MNNFSKRSLNSKDKISKTKDYIIKLIRNNEDQDYIDYAMKCFRRSYEPLSKKDWIAEGKVDEEIMTSMEVFSKDNQEMKNFNEKLNSLQESLGLEKTNFSNWQKLKTIDKSDAYFNNDYAVVFSDGIVLIYQKDPDMNDSEFKKEVKNDGYGDSPCKIWESNPDENLNELITNNKIDLSKIDKFLNNIKIKNFSEESVGIEKTELDNFDKKTKYDIKGSYVDLDGKTKYFHKIFVADSEEEAKKKFYSKVVPSLCKIEEIKIKNFSDKYEYQCPCHHTRSDNPEEVCPVCKMKANKIIKSKDKNFTEDNKDTYCVIVRHKKNMQTGKPGIWSPIGIEGTHGIVDLPKLKSKLTPDGGIDGTNNATKYTKEAAEYVLHNGIDTSYEEGKIIPSSDADGKKYGALVHFTEENIDIDVKDEASAREYGEALAKNVFGDKFDQKIFDGVFASALEECGENWDAVANYLKNCYTGSKNFSNNLKRFKGNQQKLWEKEVSHYSNDDVNEVLGKDPKYLNRLCKDYNLTEDEVKEVLDAVIHPFENFNKENKEMKNFCDRLCALQESVGLEPSASQIMPNSTPAESTTPSELNDNKVEVTSTMVGDSQTADNPQVVNLSETPAVLEEKPKDTTPTPEEAKCPACGKKLILNFESLSDEEVNEIATEANEITQYPEQYETEADQIHAFSDWLQNSRYKDFCDEAIFKAFCGLKK